MIRRLALLCALGGALAASAQTRLQTQTGAALTLDNSTGRIAELRDAAGRLLLTGGEIWSIGYRDGENLGAAAFLEQGGTVAVQTTPGGAHVRFVSPDLTLGLHVAALADHFEIAGEIERAPREIIRFSVPARLNFVPDACERLVFPQRGNTSLGIALTGPFFRQHTDGGKLVGKSIGPHAYIRLFGANLNQLGDNPPRVPVTVTAEGREWFGPARTTSLERETFCINRASAPGQYTVSLVDSPNGPLLSGHDLGGKGLLLRFGARTGDQRERESATQRGLVIAALDSLSRRHPERFRDKDVVLLAPAGAPAYGSWTATTIPEWQAALGSAPFVARSGARLVIATTQAEGLAALDTARTAAILNPYGETLPLGNSETWQAVVDQIRDFVRAGGFWWEMGGYPFYRVFEPEPFRSIAVTYPSAVADFLYLQTADSGVAVYGHQPLPTRPWEGRDNPAVRMHASTLEAGGEAAGGYLDRGWFWLLAAGESHRYPPVCLVPQIPVRQAIARYKESLGLNRPLAEKIRPTRNLNLESFKSAVLVRARAGTAAEHIAMLGLMPPGVLFHFSEYLHGGFDKQYPDHLPPRASYGTEEQLAELYRRGHDMGHLMMPYVNTSWWCIEPKGPTFERVGDEPLLIRLDGTHALEQYASNKGYSVCFWHPEVIAAHRRTSQEMAKQFPSDVLLQDQVGARSFRWDLNPAAPYATAYLEGMHSMSIEDTEFVALATEDGYDRVAQFEAMLCGMAWGMIPTDGKRATNHNKFHFVDGEWEFFPLFGYLAHEHSLFTTHDLGHFISDPERLAYALAFGYGMSETCNLDTLKRADRKAWLFWLDAVQKTVCAEYGGQPLLDFSYPLAKRPGDRTDVMLARYRGVSVLANIGNRPLPVAAVQAPEFAAYAGATLAGPGFLAVGPRVQAAMLADDDGGTFGFAVRHVDGKTQGGVLAPPAARLPRGVPANVLQGLAWQELDKQEPSAPTQDGDFLAAPEGATLRQYNIPTNLAGQSPTAWPERSRTIVVPVLADIPTSWTEVNGETWAEWLRASDVLRQAGYTVETVAEAKAFVDLLRLPPAQRPFAVINPGGESFYGDAPDATIMLERIAGYIRHGGIWWETGGYSFHGYAYPGPDGRWQRENIGPRGASILGFGCGGYDVDDPPRPLRATDIGKQWLGTERVARLQQLQAGVQRPFTGRPEALDLVLGGGDGLVSGIRGDGWGWLWRLGGFRPPAEVARLAVIGTLEHLATQPWPAPPRKQQNLFWSVSR